MASELMREKEVPIARKLARAALAGVPRDLPPEALEKAKDCLLDFLACAFETKVLPWGQQAIAVVKPFKSGSTVIGTNITGTPAEAAFANGTLGHSLVREDTHVGSICHHGVVLWPSLLALSQRTPVSGASILNAAIIGYEAGCRIGRWLMTSDLARLYRPTGLIGPMGASLAAAVMLKMNESQTTAALSFAANNSSGLNQWPHTGGSEMFFHAGFAARNAIMAVELGELNAYASENIFEGAAGVFAAYRREPVKASIELFAGGRPEILDVYSKTVPACNFTQTASQAALRVTEKLGNQLSKVRAIEVKVPTPALRYPGSDYTGPFERSLQAKMSIQFGVAAALHRREAVEENYHCLNDPAIQRLIDITRVDIDEAMTKKFPTLQGAEVSVTLEDGSVIRERMDDIIKASSDQIRTRFKDSASAVVGSQCADEIIARVIGLQDEKDAGRIASLCAVK